MHDINHARVILGGLLAGLVINLGESLLNGFVLAGPVAAELERLGMAAPGVPQIALFWIVGFATGIVMVWLYAAMRPRLGAGVQSAVTVGVAVWALISLFPTVGFWAMGMFPGGMLGIAVIWALIEVPLAAVAGAWLYTEELVTAPT